MNDPLPVRENPQAEASREEILSALFANMVIQQTNMAMRLLGKMAHPETGEFMRDVESARMFIDQLEMLEAKTKGNLSKEEEGLLKQALTALRMGFVEAIDAPAHEAPRPEAKAPPASALQPEAARAPSTNQPLPVPSAEAPAPAEESRKKFSKKY